MPSRSQAKTGAKTTSAGKGRKATGASPSPATQATSKSLSKKAAKAQAAARKQAAKTTVRLSRSARRAESQPTAGKKTKAQASATKLEARQAQAPQSARISAVRGPVQEVASQTRFASKVNDDRRWVLIDAAEQTVGRLATQIAMILRGKHKPTFTPNNDVGDFVVVVNASQVRFTSDKEDNKTYNYHSGFIGGIKYRTPAEYRQRHPEKILWNAVKGMVPRTPLGRRQMLKLKIYTGDKHPHTAQSPVAWQLRYNSAPQA